MAEDHEFQPAPEGHRLCANSCGFFGSPSTLNLCSKCFKDQIRSDPSQSDVESSVHVAAEPVAVLPVSPSPHAEPSWSNRVEAGAGVVNRCGTCRKRVGLTGFRCRCGVTCCGTHRYPKQHGCTFDYKGAGKEAIARENPVVRAQKLRKI